MIIGHLPAGYLISRMLYPRFASRALAWKPFLWVGCLGAVAPDLDMLYFHLIDHRLHHHHTFWTHYPIIWSGLFILSLAWFHSERFLNNAILGIIFSLNGFIHMLLDTIVGDIWWLAPFIDKPIAIFTVIARYKPWWLNFLLHWSFALELAVFVWAIYLRWRFPDHSEQTVAENVISDKEDQLVFHVSTISEGNELP